MFCHVRNGSYLELKYSSIDKIAVISFSTTFRNNFLNLQRSNTRDDVERIFLNQFVYFSFFVYFLWEAFVPKKTALSLRQRINPPETNKSRITEHRDRQTANCVDEFAAISTELEERSAARRYCNSRANKRWTRKKWSTSITRNPPRGQAPFGFRDRGQKPRQRAKRDEISRQPLTNERG